HGPMASSSGVSTSAASQTLKNQKRAGWLSEVRLYYRSTHNIFSHIMTHATGVCASPHYFLSFLY
uniref:Uncharacterized protein n=1 Tax=Myripristis murdjan TaxID=586833 RepID=A0A667Z642_9TELE